MSQLFNPEFGKFSPEFLSEKVFSHLGSYRKDVLVAPGSGLDNGVIEIDQDRVLVITTDPFFFDVNFGLSNAAWFAWHITGSDIATCGFPPTHITLNFSLPLSMTDDDFVEIMEVCHAEAKNYGAAIVGGHTGRYAGVQYPFLGTATFMSVCPRDEYITPQMVQVGDYVVVTKGVPISAIGMLAYSFPNTLKTRLNQEIFENACKYVRYSSSMKDSLIASSVGLRNNGVTCMHDATEGGILNALYEIANASSVGLKINLDDVFIPPEAKDICSKFSLDPFSSVSLGTLVITVRPNKVSELLKSLSNENIHADIIGEVIPETNGKFTYFGKEKRELVPCRKDSFWSVLSTGIKEKWD